MLNFYTQTPAHLQVLTGILVAVLLLRCLLWLDSTVIYVFTAIRVNIRNYHPNDLIINNIFQMTNHLFLFLECTGLGRLCEFSEVGVRIKY